jgi:hypothetical protein
MHSLIKIHDHGISPSLAYPWLGQVSSVILGATRRLLDCNPKIILHQKEQLSALLRAPAVFVSTPRPYHYCGMPAHALHVSLQCSPQWLFIILAPSLRLSAPLIRCVPTVCDESRTCCEHRFLTGKFHYLSSRLKGGKHGLSVRARPLPLPPRSSLLRHPSSYRNGTFNRSRSPSL